MQDGGTKGLAPACAVYSHLAGLQQLQVGTAGCKGCYIDEGADRGFPLF